MKIGIDLGGTKTEGIVLSSKGKELKRIRIKTEKNYSGTIKGIISIVDNFESEFGICESIGLGMPGAVSSDTTLIKNANSIWLNGKPFKKDLETKLNRSINLANDANCFTLSEAMDGAGKDEKIVFGVILGTGVGGGISINKKILEGKNKIGGEWGHITLPNKSDDEKKYVKKCYCGKIGCIETYLSGPGFESSFNLRYSKEYNTHQIIKGFSENDHNCIEGVERYVDHLARGLSIVCNILDPDVIVLGGGMSNIDIIYEIIPDAIRKYIFSDNFHTNIVKNVHGDSGGVRGAAWLA